MNENERDSTAIHAGHRARVKEEFRQKGLEHFPHHKVLELLLFYAIRRGDTNPTAHRLMERFGSLSGVFDAPMELLMEVEGVGLESATLIKLIPAIMRAYLDDKVDAKNMLKTCADAKEFVRYKFLGEEEERVLLVCMASNGKVIQSSWISQGTRRSVEFSPAAVVRAALRCGAVKALLAHNHPDGICNPSSRDLRTTSILFEELARVGVGLMDHIIIAPDGVYSMVEHGMFPAHRR
ncbi:MAG TPA: RadC family protein [Clostridiales bacterium]|nr:RadC family protein [Clostridiales bacterium]